jgi:hypothetical protein
MRVKVALLRVLRGDWPVMVLASASVRPVKY